MVPTEYKKLTLYRLLYGHYALDINQPIQPSVPNNTIEGENKTLKRICTAPNLSDCLTGIGPNIIGMKVYSELMRQNDRELDLDIVTLPFTKVEFDVNQRDPDVWLPGKVVKHVPDAFYSQECWLMNPTVPSKAEQIWLVDGEIREGSILIAGEKRKYCMVTRSEWSETEQKPKREFLEKIIEITGEWLKQDLQLGKECQGLEEKGLEKQKTSLQNKIIKASGKVSSGDKNFKKEGKQETIEIRC